MVYNAEISRENPTCFIFLIDQSGSMSDVVGGDPNKKKANAVADAINRLLMETAIKCTKDDGVRDYIDVSVIGYGKSVGPAFAGSLANRDLIPINEIVNNPAGVVSCQKDDGAGGLATFRFPVWVYPVAESFTPMCEALSYAKNLLVNQWLPQHPDSFPPLIFNITDGESTDGNPFNHAEEIKKLATADGNVLLFNVHLSSKSVKPFIFPDNQENLPDEYAKLLFSMSSNLTPQMQELAKERGYSDISNTSKGFVYNTEIVSLIHALTIGTRRTLEGEQGMERKLPSTIHSDGTSSLKVSESICIDIDSSKIPIIKSTSRSSDNVHFSVAGPKTAKPGSIFLLTFWAYLNSQKDEVLKRIYDSHSHETTKILYKGPVKIERETQIILFIEIEDLILKQNTTSIYWTSEITSESFLVSVPDNVAIGTKIGKISLLVEGIEISNINFSIEISDYLTQVQSLPVDFRFHQNAFASYSTEDAKEVLARIQAMEIVAPWLKVYIDFDGIRAGQYWKDELKKSIANMDVFYLFWSEHASKSDWVRREWQCALNSRGLDYIQPVPLVNPDKVPPPPELSLKQFKDKWSCYIEWMNFSRSA